MLTQIHDTPCRLSTDTGISGQGQITGIQRTAQAAGFIEVPKESPKVSRESSLSLVTKILVKP